MTMPEIDLLNLLDNTLSAARTARPVVLQFEDAERETKMWHDKLAKSKAAFWDEERRQALLRSQYDALVAGCAQKERELDVLITETTKFQSKLDRLTANIKKIERTL
jgi:septal ring factor EnvC (AmiA/AmiB activator)